MADGDRVEGYTNNATLYTSGNDLLQMTRDPAAITLLQAILDQLRLVNARLNAGIKTQALGVGVTVPATVTL